MTPFSDSREPETDLERAELEGFIQGMGFAVLEMNLPARLAQLALMRNESGEEP